MKLAGIAMLCIASFAFADTFLIEVTQPTPAQQTWTNSHHLETTPTRLGVELVVPDSLFPSFSNTFSDFRVVDTLENMQRQITGYPSPQEVIDSLYALADAYSDITQLVNLGPSTCHQYYLDGDDDYVDFQYDVICLKVSDNPEMEEDEANVFFMGGIHAREAISIPVPLHLLTYLLQNYGVDDDVTAWIDDNQIWFVPLINPDGYHVSWESLHLYHRKNLSDTDENGAPTYSAYDGVDLNRNFGYVWGPNGTSPWYNSNLYNGPYAWSETEVCYLRDLIQDRKFWGGVTYHSYGQWVLYPLGHLNGACSYDHAIMGDLAIEMAQTIPSVTGSGYYTPMQASGFTYTCQGTMGDWSYAEERLFGFTLELATTYIPSPALVPTICNDNLQAALIFLDRASHSTITGHVCNADGEPLVAEVYVEEIDSAAGMSTVEPVFSGENFGRYWRHLLPGDYTVTFTADGYLPATFANVAVADTGRTVLEVTLECCWTPDVRIEADSCYVTLTWQADVNHAYEVYSSSTLTGDYTIALGEFLAPGVWRQYCEAEQKFYRVRRSMR